MCVNKTHRFPPTSTMTLIARQSRKSPRKSSNLRKLTKHDAHIHKRLYFKHGGYREHSICHVGHDKGVSFTGYYFNIDTHNTCHVHNWTRMLREWH